MSLYGCHYERAILTLKTLGLISCYVAFTYCHPSEAKRQHAHVRVAGWNRGPGREHFEFSAFATSSI